MGLTSGNYSIGSAKFCLQHLNFSLKFALAFLLAKVFYLIVTNLYIENGYTPCSLLLKAWYYQKIEYFFTIHSHMLWVAIHKAHNEKEYWQSCKVRHASCRIGSQLFFFPSLVSGIDMIICVGYELKEH